METSLLDQLLDRALQCGSSGAAAGCTYSQFNHSYLEKWEEAATAQALRALQKQHPRRKSGFLPLQGVCKPTSLIKAHSAPPATHCSSQAVPVTSRLSLPGPDKRHYEPTADWADCEPAPYTKLLAPTAQQQLSFDLPSCEPVSQQDFEAVTAGCAPIGLAHHELQCESVSDSWQGQGYDGLPLDNATVLQRRPEAYKQAVQQEQESCSSTPTSTVSNHSKITQRPNTPTGVDRAAAS